MYSIFSHVSLDFIFRSPVFLSSAWWNMRHRRHICDGWRSAIKECQNFRLKESGTFNDTFDAPSFAPKITKNNQPESSNNVTTARSANVARRCSVALSPAGRAERNHITLDAAPSFIQPNVNLYRLRHHELHILQQSSSISSDFSFDEHRYWQQHRRLSNSITINSTRRTHMHTKECTFLTGIKHKHPFLIHTGEQWKRVDRTKCLAHINCDVL